MYIQLNYYFYQQKKRLNLDFQTRLFNFSKHFHLLLMWYKTEHINNGVCFDLNWVDFDQKTVILLKRINLLPHHTPEVFLFSFHF